MTHTVSNLVQRPRPPEAAAQLPQPTSAPPTHSLSHCAGFHGAQGVIHHDQVIAIGVTGCDIKASEGEAQHGVGIAPQGPLAAGEGWVGAVGKAGRGEASLLPPSGVQGKFASVCGKQEERQSLAEAVGPAAPNPAGVPPGLASPRRPRLPWAQMRPGSSISWPGDRRRDVLAVTKV